jgi:hypothetical protein
MSGRCRIFHLAGGEPPSRLHALNGLGMRLALPPTSQPGLSSAGRGGQVAAYYPDTRSTLLRGKPGMLQGINIRVSNMVGIAALWTYTPGEPASPDTLS